MRKDVLKVAENLAVKSNIGVDELYYWLMDVGRSKSKNPRLLNFIAGDGIVFVEGERDSNCIEKSSRTTNNFNYDCRADYWEDKILERQEKYMD